MAQYTVKFSCGHDWIVNLVGPRKDRDRRIKWLETYGDCPNCYKKRMKDLREAEAVKRKEESEVASANAKEYGLPELSGSEKQIEWALRIRQEFLESFLEEGQNNEQMLSVASFLEENTCAHFWIDNRKTLVDAFYAYTNDKTNRPSFSESYAEAIEVTAPENQVYDGLVRIECPEGKIFAYYEKNENFRHVVKDLGYKWNVEKRAWEKDITAYNGSQVDRAAELGNHLLKAGFAVQIADDNIRAAAVSGKFKLEQTRWILLRIEGDYKGYLSINFPRGDETIYQSARKITGSRWSNPNIVVPINSADEVLDFAEMKNFAISPAAQKAIDNYRTSFKVVVPKDAPKHPKDKMPIDILTSSREVIDDLKDD